MKEWSIIIGNKANYGYLFANTNWDDTIFKPLYDMKASSMYRCFMDNTSITRLDNKYDGSPLIIDLTQLTTSTSTSCLRAFYGMNNLVSINHIISCDWAVWTDAFRACYALENISFSGIIGTALDIHWSTRLSRGSLLSILNVCNKENAGVTITLPAKCIDGKTVTQTYIANDTELSTALTNANNNGYTIVYS